MASILKLGKPLLKGNPTMNPRYRRLRSAALATAAWIVGGRVAVAQVPLEEPVSKSYVLAYIMIVLVVALALAIVLRSPGRATDVRPKSSDS
jgi:hypothetical protein